LEKELMLLLIEQIMYFHKTRGKYEL